ncbi:MAG: CDP-2,3-bis-(O-geranylgeranyl)-sn-glycerol synthase [Methanospirillum sp.]|nr:CDP-2,3-bis-(O-geranylgeranyl)-sn-glycerol synthase [Methanospirillum sp.]
MTLVDGLTPAALLLAALAACWIMLPAWLPNPVAALFGGGRPIDGGRVLGDGHRLLGNGKTWRGFAAGIIAGLGCGALQIAAQGTALAVPLPAHTPLSVTALAVGALLGDIVKSFFKRRLGRERGEAWPLVDQYDLVVGAFALLALVDPGWIATNITPSVLVFVLVLTPLLHRGMNLIGYAAGIKEEPW